LRGLRTAAPTYLHLTHSCPPHDILRELTPATSGKRARAAVRRRQGDRCSDQAQHRRIWRLTRCQSYWPNVCNGWKTDLTDSSEIELTQIGVRDTPFHVSLSYAYLSRQHRRRTFLGFGGAAISGCGQGLANSSPERDHHRRRPSVTRQPILRCRGYAGGGRPADWPICRVSGRSAAQGLAGSRSSASIFSASWSSSVARSRSCRLAFGSLAIGNIATFFGAFAECVPVGLHS
jgi:hypothetical protein